MRRKPLCILLWIAALAICGFQAQNFPGVGLASSSGGTVNTIAKYSAASVITNSALSDNGTNVTSTEAFIAPAAQAVYSVTGQTAGGFGFNASTYVVTNPSGSIAFAFNNTNLAGPDVGNQSLNFSSTFPSGGTPDVGLSRSAAGSLAVGNGVAGNTTGTLNLATEVVNTPNAATWTFGSNSELLTIAAAATTDTTGNLLPANSIIEAVVVRVTTVIPTAATFTVGDATIAARFATGVAVAATTTAVGLTHIDLTGTSGPRQTAAAKVRITPSSTPGAATGVVRITVFYRQFVAPTS